MLAKDGSAQIFKPELPAPIPVKNGWSPQKQFLLAEQYTVWAYDCSGQNLPAQCRPLLKLEGATADRIKSVRWLSRDQVEIEFNTSNLPRQRCTFENHGIYCEEFHCLPAKSLAQYRILKKDDGRIEVSAEGNTFIYYDSGFNQIFQNQPQNPNPCSDKCTEVIQHHVDCDKNFLFLRDASIGKILSTVTAVDLVAGVEMKGLGPFQYWSDDKNEFIDYGDTLYGDKNSKTNHFIRIANCSERKKNKTCKLNEIGSDFYQIKEPPIWSKTSVSFSYLTLNGSIKSIKCSRIGGETSCQKSSTVSSESLLSDNIKNERWENIATILNAPVVDSNTIKIIKSSNICDPKELQDYKKLMGKTGPLTLSEQEKLLNLEKKLANKSSLFNLGSICRNKVLMPNGLSEYRKKNAAFLGESDGFNWIDWEKYHNEKVPKKSFAIQKIQVAEKYQIFVITLAPGQQQEENSADDQTISIEDFIELLKSDCEKFHDKNIREIFLKKSSQVIEDLTSNRKDAANPQDISFYDVNLKKIKSVVEKFCTSKL